MATPSDKFPEGFHHNLTLKADENAVAGSVDLKVCAVEDEDGIPQFMSVWQLSPEELEQVNASGGLVYAYTLGAPYLYIAGKTPEPLDT